MHHRDGVARKHLQMRTNRLMRAHIFNVFCENLNPAKDLEPPVKKRRSIFRIAKYIRRRRLQKSKPAKIPANRRCPAISTLDGLSEQGTSLSVPPPSPARSSVSPRISIIEPSQSPSTDFIRSARTSQPQIPGSQSLESYERNLTIQGDSRRHKSTFNISFQPENDGEDRFGHSARPLSRASPLFGPSAKSGEQSLMEKALQKHQLEKAALFRFRGKDRVEEEGPAFHMSFGPASSPERGDGDEVDPFGVGGGVKKARSMPFATAGLANTEGRRKTTIQDRGSVPTITSIMPGVPPASWSRYPSHSRPLRTGSAGKSDGVRVRDWWEEGQANETRETERRRAKEGWRTRLGLTIRPSDGKVRRVLRYYSGLFSGMGGLRRTSVATGGRLRDPELEVLPPVLPSWGSHEADVKGEDSVRTGKDGRERKRARAGDVRSHSADAGRKGKSNADIEMRGLLRTPTFEAAKRNTSGDLSSRRHTRTSSKGSDMMDPLTPAPTPNPGVRPTDAGAELPTEMVAKMPGDPALTLDGAVDEAILRIGGKSLSPRTSALFRAGEYQRECIMLPGSLDGETSDCPSKRTLTSDRADVGKKSADGEVEMARKIPLPETLSTGRGELVGTKKMRSVKSQRGLKGFFSNSSNVENKFKGVRDLKIDRQRYADKQRDVKALISPVPKSVTGSKLSPKAKSLLYLPEVEDRGRCVAFAGDVEDRSSSESESASPENVPMEPRQVVKHSQTRPENETTQDAKPTTASSHQQSCCRKDDAREGVTVRRFPSVTVVDDRKGQYRSISLISTIRSGRSRSGGSPGFSFEKVRSLNASERCATRDAREVSTGVLCADIGRQASGEVHFGDEVHGERQRPVSGASRYDTVRTRMEDDEGQGDGGQRDTGGENEKRRVGRDSEPVRASTMDLLRGVQERERDELGRLRRGVQKSRGQW
ncbi:hypothetical protein CAC42_1465 [Sphaceloma murrayae]|uniref:Uncharacterized protein n=1 Tax=Sphaceloma murrayae TaxID=2082308 RepID=A0A2K1QY92_9PEZI|nr:hypothetical protein CAC42_1465 [Sphaceloma murrayae]